MPRRTKNKKNISEIVNKKIPKDLPVKTMKLTVHALRWIFLAIFIFITVGIFILFITGGESYIQAIIGYSITGFFTFFMGYFGWILAQSVIEILKGEDKNNNYQQSYYFKKNKYYK
ncbi:MAG: hypothetical protein V5A68_04495 [Candidatus Thermoplasmatota archaeon]